MRDLKELYEILLKFYTKQPRNYICNTIDIIFYKGLINIDEMTILVKHFKTQRPNKDMHPEFYNHKMAMRPFYPSSSDAWFLLSDAPILGKRVRKEFITKIISTL